MTNSDIHALIAFLLLLIPYGLVWFAVFRRFKERIGTTLSKWVLTLVSLIAFVLYYYMLFWLGQGIDGSIGDSITMAGFAVFVFSVLPLAIILIVTLILTIIYYSNKKADT